MTTLSTIAIYPPCPTLTHALHDALRQPLHIQRGQLAMDGHNASVRSRLLHKLAAERNYAEGRRVLKQYSVQVWRGLALSKRLREAGIEVD
jgi:hypothetical protein